MVVCAKYATLVNKKYVLSAERREDYIAHPVNLVYHGGFMPLACCTLPTVKMRQPVSSCHHCTSLLKVVLLQTLAAFPEEPRIKCR